MAFCFLGVRIHTINRNSKLLDHLNKVLTGLVINLTIIFVLWFVFQPTEYSRKFLFVTYLAFTLSILFWRSVWHYTIRYYRAKGYNIRNVAIIGKGKLVKALASYFNNTPELGYRLVETFDDNSENSIERRGYFEEFLIKNDINVIFCGLPDYQNPELRKLLILLKIT